MAHSIERPTTHGCDLNQVVSSLSICGLWLCNNLEQLLGQSSLTVSTLLSAAFVGSDVELEPIAVSVGHQPGETTEDPQGNA